MQRASLVLAVGGLALGAVAFADEAFVAAYEKLRADDSYQFDFEKIAPPEPPELEWLANLLSAISDLLSFFRPILTVIFWLGAIVLVGAVLYYLAREINRRMARANADDSDTNAEVYTPAPALSRALLEEADRLAGLGKFADAVRVLLYRSIEDIQKFHPNTLRIAMTSREIADLQILRPGARGAFARIAAAVEQSHFAGRAIDAKVFAACRSAYGDFATQEGAA